MLSKFKYYELSTKNLKIINNFFKTEDKDSKITAKYLNWWYLEKKFSDSSFIFLKYRSSIVSIATINNQKININKKLYNNQCDIKLKMETPLKFTNWLFNSKE